MTNIRNPTFKGLEFATFKKQGGTVLKFKWPVFNGEQEMRELKFRAWMPKEQKWYIGGAIQLTAMIGNTFGLSEANGKVIELQQSTGYIDIHGVETYEGDLVQRRDGKQGTVIWHQDSCGFAMAFGDDEPLFSLCSWFEVVGNVFESTGPLGDTKTTK